MSILKSNSYKISGQIDSLSSNLNDIQATVNNIKSVQDGYNMQLEAQRKLLFQERDELQQFKADTKTFEQNIINDVGVLKESLELFIKNYDKFCAMEGLNLLMLAKDSYYCKTALDAIGALPWYKRLGKKGFNKALEEALKEADHNYKEIIDYANKVYQTKDVEVGNASRNATRAAQQNTTGNGNKGSGNNGGTNGKLN